MLTTYRLGPDTGRPLLIVHGLFGSARNWGVIAKRLSAERPVVTVDMRNHGSSPWFDRHTYPDMANDLAEVIAELGGRADVVGHSMGGKAAMMLALTRPDLVNRLIVADIAPVGYSHTQAHNLAAMRDMDLADLKSRSQADERLAVSVQDKPTRAFLLQSLDLKSDPPRWMLNLQALERDMGAILGWPDVVGDFVGPVLFLSGGASDYVLPEHRPAIKSLFPVARFAKIPKAGHWLHADAPKPFGESVAAFMSA